MPTPTTWSATSNVPLTGVNQIDALIGGTRWTSSTITYSFPNLNSSWSSDPTAGYTNPDGEPWSSGYKGLYASDMAAVRTALASWSNVANITFVEVADNASTVGDLRFAYSVLSDSAQAWTYLPDDTAYAGDVWFNVNSSNYSYQWSPGSYEYLTAIHEIGHALGLKHPFDGGSLNSATLPPALDTQSFSVMSYSAAPGNTNSWFSYEPTTPMVLDIASIQAIYGANYSYNSGDTNYVFSGTGTYNQTIWDGGGIDTITYNSSVGGVIDLREGIDYGCRLGQTVNVLQYDHGSVTTLGSVNNVWIAYGANIENAVGGSGNDIITGNALNNTLDGGAGNDILDGQTGADTLIGGTGNDTYIVDNPGDVVIEAANAGTDTVQSSISWTLGANVENLTLTGTAPLNGTGNALDNVLTGNAGDNRLDGGAGADILIGGAGNDTYVVDNPGDRVYETTTIGGTVDAGGIDTVLSSVTWTLGSFVENLTLTGSADINGTGNALNNILIGNDGNNILNGGGGLDTFAGGLGNDTYVLDQEGELLTVTEAADAGIDTLQIAYNSSHGTAKVVDLTLPNLTAVENVAILGAGLFNLTGNDLDNALTGNASANILVGGKGNDILDGKAGADTLIGGDGNDTLIGGLGKDTLTGGAGNDQFVFNVRLGARNADVITDFVTCADVIDLDNSVFKALGGLGALTAGAFCLGTSATDRDDRIIYNVQTGALYYDPDGVGGHEAVLIATLGTTTHPTVSAADFFVV